MCGTCFKLFTTLSLADKHIKLSGHQVSLSPPEEAVNVAEVGPTGNDSAFVKSMIWPLFWQISFN